MRQFKRDQKQDSNKLHLDKYYTDRYLAKELIDKTLSVVGIENITEIVEPSAGDGAFSDQIDGCIAYDIEPCNDRIQKQDFLELNIPYKKGRLFIGNPPFGDRNRLSVQFFKKCIDLGDYIAFILPISQLNNNQQMYEFDLVHSEDLGSVYFTDRYIHVCFNIYQRPHNGGYNSRPKNTSEFIKIVEIRCQNKPIPIEYDICICAWGAGSVGKTFDPNKRRHAKEFYISVKKPRYRESVINIIKNTSWCDVFPMTSTPNILQWQVYKVVNEALTD